MQKQIKIISFIIFLPIVVLFQFGQSNYLHYHVNNQGILVSHSHPYQIPDNENSPISDHHHSNSEMMLLQVFDSNYEFQGSQINSPEVTTQLILDNSKLQEYFYIGSKTKTYKTLRAPPSLFLS